MQDMRTTVCFPPAEITRELAQQIDPSHEILIFQFVQDYDSHRTIAEIYARLEKLQCGQTLIFVGYSLLTQLNISLLYLLGNFFNKIIVEIHDNEGYRFKLESYRQNEKVLNYLYEILTASCNVRQENLTIWSIIPITVLYGKIHRCVNEKILILFVLITYFIQMYLYKVLYKIFGNRYILVNKIFFVTN